MKRIKTLYWIITGLFLVFMLFTSIPEITRTKQDIEFMHSLGYPAYLSPFLGIAKILGIIALLVPGYPHLKEWAYAGFAFDLLGATYSGIAVGGFMFQQLFMVLPIGFLVLSYVLYRKTSTNN
jgi:hypothetical protein